MEYETNDDQELSLVQREVMEECMEYADNVARSEEDGWFYADDEGE